MTLYHANQYNVMPNRVLPADVILNATQTPFRDTERSLRCRCPYCQSGSGIWTKEYVQFQCFDCKEQCLASDWFTLHAISVEAQIALIDSLDPNEVAAKLYHRCIFADGQAKRWWGRTRALERAIVQTFELGFSPKHGRLLSQLLTNEGQIAYIEAGLLGENERGVYDFFRDRIIFPVRNNEGRVVGFSGRVIDNAKSPKYINTAQNALFDKGSELYGMNLAHAAIVEAGEVYVFEGYMDVIQAHQQGMLNTVAVMGTALTEAHLCYLATIAPRIIVMMDGDRAGLSASLSNLGRLGSHPHSHKLRFAACPTGHDPDSLLRTVGADALKACGAAALDPVEFVLANETFRYDAQSITGAALRLSAIKPLWRSAPVSSQMQYSQALQKTLGLEHASVEFALMEHTQAGLVQS